VHPTFIWVHMQRTDPSRFFCCWFIHLELYLLTFDCAKTFSLSNATWKHICSNSPSPPVPHQMPLYLWTWRRYTNPLIIKPPLATARAASYDVPFHLFVCLSPKCKKTRFSQKLTNLELWSLLTTYRKSYMAFQRTHFWTCKIQDGGGPPSWKSTWRHFSAVGGPIWIKFSRLVQNDIDCSDMVEIETGSKIPIWQMFGRINGTSSQSTCHIVGCYHLANSATFHPSATCHIAGCCLLVNSMLWSQSHVPHLRVKEFHPP